METPAKESFWKTLPGIITAIASLITAIGGLLLILSQLGVFDAKNEMAEATAKPPAKSEVITPPIPPPTSTLTATAEDVEYTVLSQTTKAYSATELKLILSMKVSCKQTTVGFRSEMFRLEIDGVKNAPVNELSNKWLDTHSDWKENIEFIIPKDLKTATLIVGYAGSPRTSAIPLTLKGKNSDLP